MKRQAVLGVDLGGTNLRVGKVLGDDIVKLHSQPVSAQAPADIVLDEIAAAIAQLIDREVAGIGIGVPSIVDVEKGIVYSVQNIPSWQEVPLKEILEKKFKVPVYVNNDANCFALGECYYGQGKNFRHIVGLAIGTGLGAGIIIDGKLYNGSNCGAGEIGTIPWREQTVEYYCSGQYFQKVIGIPGKILHERAGRGDKEALAALASFGHEFGLAIMIAMYAYDPEIIILGGSVSRAFPFFEKSMRARLQEFAYPTALRRLVITRSEKENIHLLGAAALFFDALKRK